MHRTVLSGRPRAGIAVLSVVSAAAALTYAAPADAATAARPVITSVTPYRLATAGGTQVTITGSNLLGSTSVRFGTTAATAVTQSSATRLVVIAPAEQAGLVHTTVTAPGGTSATVRADVVQFQNPPVVTGLTRTTGPVVGGVRVTVLGTDLDGVTGVRFGSAAGTAFSRSADGSTVSATAPAGHGAVDVRVTGSYGTSAAVAADHFLYGGPEFAAADVVATPQNDTVVHDVACPAAGTCYAVGYTGTEYNSGNVNPLVTVLSHGAWTPVPVSTPSGLTSHAELDRIDCPAVGECYALGTLYDTGSRPSFAGALRDGVWTPTALPTDTSWHSLTCAGPRQCLVAGTDGTATRFLRLDGDTVTQEQGWSAPEGSTGISVDGTDCPTAASCVAWGSFLDANGVSHAFAEQRVGGYWFGSALPTSGGRTPADVQAVTCSSATACTGYGNFGDGRPMKVVLDGSTVTTGSVPVSGLPDTVTHRVAPVGCASATTCLAVTDNASASSLRATGYAGVLAGTGYRAAQYGPTGSDVGEELAGVLCATGRACLATGTRVKDSGYVTASAVPVVLLPTGSTLTQIDLPVGPAGSAQSGFHEATGVGACAPDSAFCVVIVANRSPYGPGATNYAVTVTG